RRHRPSSAQRALRAVERPAGGHDADWPPWGRRDGAPCRRCLPAAAGGRGQRDPGAHGCEAKKTTPALGAPAHLVCVASGASVRPPSVLRRRGTAVVKAHGETPALVTASRSCFPCKRRKPCRAQPEGLPHATALRLT